MIQNMPNLFHIISPDFKHQSLLSVITTYALFPLGITMGVLAGGIVMPNGLGGALTLFLAVSICSLLLAIGLSSFRGGAKNRVQACLYLLLSSFTPLTIWYGFALAI
jgi:hypothetical protein